MFASWNKVVMQMESATGPKGPDGGSKSLDDYGSCENPLGCWPG